jgi:hypothetical protein
MGVASTANPSETTASVLPRSPPSSDREPTSEKGPPSTGATGEDEQPIQLLAHINKQGASLLAKSVRRVIWILLPVTSLCGKAIRVWVVSREVKIPIVCSSRSHQTLGPHRSLGRSFVVGRSEG